MHECTQKDLIDNIRSKLSEVVNKFESKFNELFSSYNELKLRTELQEEKIASIKSDLKELKDTVKEGFEKAEKNIETKLNELKDVIRENKESTKKENNKVLTWVIGAMGVVILGMSVYIATCGKFGGN